MKKFGCGTVFVFFLIGLAIFYALFMDNLLKNQNNLSYLEENVKNEVDDQIFLEAKPDLKIMKNSVYLRENGLHKLIGKTTNYIRETYGEPFRIDLAAYDYEWWVYPKANSYMQIGVDNDHVVTVYFIGEESLIAPFHIGQSYEDISKKFKFQKQLSVNVQSNSYQFNLSEEELLTRPLFQIGDVFIQLYFDTFTNSLSGIRYLDGKTLVKHRPYSVVYRGELIEPKKLTDEEWRKVESGTSLQILDITNIIRKRHQLNELIWDEETSIVAYYHSEDMKRNEYFSHKSPTHGELKDRLKKQGVLYQLAGENIAAKYVDAIAVVEGWLNSEGHRVNLLHEEFTHLGVGVYERYYTQNFITPW